MCVNPKDLDNDTTFWKTEKETQIASRLHIQNLKSMKPYDYYLLKPESYDVKKGEEVKERKPPPAVAPDAISKFLV